MSEDEERENILDSVLRTQERDARDRERKLNPVYHPPLKCDTEDYRSYKRKSFISDNLSVLKTHLQGAGLVAEDLVNPSCEDFETLQNYLDNNSKVIDSGQLIVLNGLINLLKKLI